MDDRPGHEVRAQARHSPGRTQLDRRVPGLKRLRARRHQRIERRVAQVRARRQIDRIRLARHREHRHPAVQPFRLKQALRVLVEEAAARIVQAVLVVARVARTGAHRLEIMLADHADGGREILHGLGRDVEYEHAVMELVRHIEVIVRGVVGDAVRLPEPLPRQPRLRAREVRLADHVRRGHAVLEPVRVHVEHEHALLPGQFHEQALPGFVNDEIAGLPPTRRGQAFLLRDEVVLAEHADRLCAVLDAIGMHVEHEHPVVAAVGDEQALVDLVEREFRGPSAARADAVAFAGAEVQPVRGRRLLPGGEVLLPEHVRGGHAAVDLSRRHVEHEHALVPGVRDEQALVRLVVFHGERQLDRRRVPAGQQHARGRVRLAQHPARAPIEQAVHPVELEDHDAMAVVVAHEQPVMHSIDRYVAPLRPETR